MLFFQVVLVLVWVTVLHQAGFDPPVLWVVGIAGLAWCGAVAALLREYRDCSDMDPLLNWRRQLAPLIIAVAVGVLGGALTGVWVLGVLPPVLALLLLNWPAGVRFRLVLLATLLLAGASFVDTQFTLLWPTGARAANWWLFAVYSSLLPAMTVLSLWWWDVLMALDRARASEVRLAATQERLRVATDVHDLQGHHLQVIALQLELAERLMSQDPVAGMTQLRAARSSVADAQQGTRDLATGIRSVPLGDELANAVDLLRAGGTRAEATVDVDADRAPAAVIGSVIRETTTNALRHGGGEWARLELTRVGDLWRYEISNDVGEPGPTGGGAGIEGMRRRVAEAGGALEVQQDATTFVVTVTVPAGRVDTP